MDRLIKCLIFDGMAKVTAIDNTAMVNKSIKMHRLSPLASAVLGRSLAVGIYLSNSIKDKDGKFSMTIDGKGGLGKIMVVGSEGNKVKGFVVNKEYSLPLRADGKIDVGGGVGTDGEIVIIKDLGLKEKYVGRAKLCTGEIAEDFSHYLMTSEGLPNVVALGVLVDKKGCVASGGIIIEAMPGISDDQLYILEDIINNFKNFSTILKEKGLDEIVNFYFGHLNATIYPEEKVTLDCNCSVTKLKGLIKSLGKTEAMDIIKEQGQIEIFYEFNSKYYRFRKEDVENIFKVK